MLGTRGESSSLPATPSPLRPLNPTSLLFLVWGGTGMFFALSVCGGWGAIYFTFFWPQHGNNLASVSGAGISQLCIFTAIYINSLPQEESIHGTRLYQYSMYNIHFLFFLLFIFISLNAFACNTFNFLGEGPNPGILQYEMYELQSTGKL